MFIQMCLKTWLVSALVTWRLTLRKPEHISFMDRNTCVTLWLLCYWKNKNGKNFSPRLKVVFFQLFGCWQRNQCCPFGAKVPLIPVKICWMWTRLWDRDVVFVFMSVLLCLSRLLSLSTWTLHWPKCQTRDKQKKKVGVFFLLTNPRLSFTIRSGNFNRFWPFDLLIPTFQGIYSSLQRVQGSILGTSKYRFNFRPPLRKSNT